VARRVGEESGVHGIRIKSRHRPAIQPQCTGGKHKVGALQRGIAKRAFFAARFIAFILSKFN